MTTNEADRIVLKHLLAQAAGIRMRAKNPVIGSRAGILEQELAERLAKFDEINRRQRELTFEPAHAA